MTVAARASAWARHVAQVRAACTFVSACAAEGIPVLPVKGIITAHTLYDVPAERRLNDVDIRIRPRDYEPLGELARRRRWALVEAKRVYRNYVLRVQDVEIDVECHVGPPQLCALRVEDMLARATTTDVLGVPTLVPDLVDHAALLVVNVFKDKLVLARDWALRDLERLAMRPAFDPEAIAARLLESRARTIGWIVANHLVVERGVTNWSAVRDALGPIKRKLYAFALAKSRNRAASWPSIVLARVGSDDPVQRIRALLTMGHWALTR